MVIVKIMDDRGKESFGIIEMQGDLLSRNESEMLGKFIGDLHFKEGTDPQSILIIGHHILNGKVVDLPKPLALLEPEPDEDEADSMDLKVKAIITKKIVFKTRPKPIITNQ